MMRTLSIQNNYYCNQFNMQIIKPLLQQQSDTKNKQTLTKSTVDKQISFSITLPDQDISQQLREYNTIQRENSYRIFFQSNPQNEQPDTCIQIFVDESQILKDYYNQLQKLDLDYHRIQLKFLDLLKMPYHQKDSISLQSSISNINSKVFEFKITINCFIVNILLFCLNFNAPVVQCNQYQNQYQIHRMYFQSKEGANKSQIEIILYRYALLKILSLLKVSCQILKYDQFDVICYQDCIEYYVQKCKKCKKEEDSNQIRAYKILLDKYKILQDSQQYYQQLQIGYSTLDKRNKFIQIHKLFEASQNKKNSNNYNTQSTIIIKEYLKQLQVLSDSMKNNQAHQETSFIQKLSISSAVADNNDKFIQIRKVLGYTHNESLKNIQVTKANIGYIEKETQENYSRFLNFINTQSFLNQEFYKHHNIQLLQKDKTKETLRSYSNIFLGIKYTAYHKFIVVYEVIIGRFKLQVVMLNLHENSKSVKYHNKLGKGSFGQINKEFFLKQRFVAKRIYFKQDQLGKQLNSNGNPLQIEQVIKQYSINKICSYLQIGPAIFDRLGFDLVCFNDCIQFYLQVCETLRDKQNNQGLYIQQIQNSIKKCVYNLHKQRIIHKDIKCDNILYSKKFRKYVLADFGLSHPIKQRVGEKSFTYYEGTPKYMSKEMTKLVQSQKKGFIDLYYNDKVSLSLSITEIYKQIYQNDEITNSEGQYSQSHPINIDSNQGQESFYEFIKLFYVIFTKNTVDWQLWLIWKKLQNNRKIEILNFIKDQLISVNIIKILQKIKLIEFEKQIIQMIQTLIQNKSKINLDKMIERNQKLLINHIRIQYIDQFYLDLVRIVYENTKYFKSVDKAIKKILLQKSFRKKNSHKIVINYIELSKMFKLNQIKRIINLLKRKFQTQIEIEDLNQVVQLYKEVKCSYLFDEDIINLIQMMEKQIFLKGNKQQKQMIQQFNKFIEKQQQQKNQLQLVVGQLEIDRKCKKLSIQQCEQLFNNYIKNTDQLNLSKMKVMQKFISHYYKQKEYEKSMTLCNLFVKSYKKFIGENNDKIFRINFFQALNLFQLGKYTESFQMVTDNLEKIIGQKHIKSSFVMQHMQLNQKLNMKMTKPFTLQYQNKIR